MAGKKLLIVPVSLLMADLEGIKSFLYAWLQKNQRTTPEYTFLQRSLRVEGIDYVGVGNSANKKDAQTNAARDFANYLVREKLLDEAQLPCVLVISLSLLTNPSAKRSMPLLGTKRPFEPRAMGPGDNYINRIFDQKKLEEVFIPYLRLQVGSQAEEVDFTSDIHGGWSLENAKARLNEYLQATRQQIGLVKYTAVGPDHNRSFLAESTVFAKRLNKHLYARETGSNKVMASRACCLSLVRQLYHAGEIEAYTGEKKKKKADEVPPTEFDIEPEVEEKLTCLLGKLGLEPNLEPPLPDPTSSEEHNMILHYKLADFEAQERQSAQSATMSLRQISAKYLEEHNQCLANPEYSALLAERSALPVHNFKARILDTIQNNQITLIKGETGCGKTTQVPQFILDSFIESGNGANCAVLVTQPRRICAISLAERMAFERCESIGTSVGYSVRFETVLPRPFGSVLFCTVGTMCRKMEAGLRGISHIVIDEIHERDVNTDFMLILIRDMIQANRDLRVVLMSATIDTTTFTDYFGDCALVELEGRTHPVTYYFLEDCVNMINYVPPPMDERKKKKRKMEDEVAADAEENCNLICPAEYPPLVARSLREMPEKEIPFTLIAGLLDHICAMNIEGAVLIFLPGWNVISTLKKFLQTHPRYSRAEYLILPLHSQVPREDQRIVFRPAPKGIVLSTNIAESSITINDVVFVIDSCLARIKMFTARNNLTSYSTVWASKTNLEQRRGRAGRVQAGFAFHLCRLGDVSAFLKKAIQPPPLDAVIEAEYTLREMKALDQNDELTPLGQILARLPLEPRLGRMLVFACAFGLGGAMALLAAHASLGSDPFVMPPDRRRLSNDQMRFEARTNSDHLAALNVYQVWAAERERNGDEAADYLCEVKELSASALRIRNILIGLDFPESALSDKPVNFNTNFCPEHAYIAALLTSGLYPNIAYHSEGRRLFTAEGKFALVHKASVNCRKNATFVFPLFTFTEKASLIKYCKSTTCFCLVCPA
ncbi:unnamed protein product [Schistocephalus solidus]|uniref:RNA helicase n=1 Tax=Schistocephalus solidus TaxID=70667 RepID=A0A3P7CJ60_SCHSO|nr:unnamed protein product [Schistocephalus solidus]